MKIADSIAMKSLKLAIIGDFSREIAIYEGFLENCRYIGCFHRRFLENHDFIVKSAAISRTWVRWKISLFETQHC